jgi:dolichyl-phosphooligosaccharide-protein glycotransferase
VARKPQTRRQPPEAAVPAKGPRPPSARVAAILRWGAVGTSVILAAWFFWTRIETPRPLVFPAPGEVRLFDTDPYYHTRHATYAATHFPHLLRWDPALYPDGAPAEYVGLFDLTIATAAVVAGGGHADAANVERVAAWVPPAIGAAAVLALLWLGWVVGGPLTGAIAVLFFVIAPGLFGNRALLGYPDHHVAEVLLGILVTVGIARLLQRARSEKPPSMWQPAVVEALPLTLFFLTWLGAPIYLVLVAVTLFIVATLDIARGEGAQAIGRAALRYGLGMAVVLVPIRLAVPWLILDMQFFAKALYGMALLGVGLLVYARAAAFLVRRRLPPLAVAALGIGIALGLAIGLIWFAPEGHLLFEELLGVKTKLVREQADIDFDRYFYLGAAPAALAILAVPIALVAAARGRDRRSAFAPILLGGIIVALWLRTHDYGYAAPGNLALLAAYVVVTIGGWLTRWWLRAILAVLLVAALAVPLALGKVVPPYRQAEKLKPLMVLDEGWVHALRFVKAHTPKLEVPIDTPVKTDHSFHHPKGDYGILAFWDFGHFIAAIAERLPLASGGISGSLAKWFVVEDEALALDPATVGLQPGTDVRYVMVDARTANDFFMAGLEMAGKELKDYQRQYLVAKMGGHDLNLWAFGGHYPKTMVSRLYVGDGTGLAHYRLIYESPEKSAVFSTGAPAPGDRGTSVTRRSTILDPTTEAQWRQLAAAGRPAPVPGGVVYDVSILPTVKVFEVVKGAVLDGRAAPNATVEARLTLRSKASGETTRYGRTATADGDGHFLLTVAATTDPDPDSDVQAVGAYELTTDGQTLGSVNVALEDVLKGGRVAVGNR